MLSCISTDTPEVGSLTNFKNFEFYSLHIFKHFNDQILNNCMIEEKGGRNAC